MIRPTFPLTVLTAAAALAGAVPAARAQFSPGPNPITGTVTAAQTLSANTGTVSATGSLQVGGTAVAITLSGSSTLVNNGTIQQTVTGRALRSTVNNLTLSVTNNAGALIQAADADAFQITGTNTAVTFTNSGSVLSLNPSGAGSQAVDWNAITTGANTLNNLAGGLLRANEADAVRPGVNGVIGNAGTILCVSTTGSSSDGIDAQTNSGVQITNSGRIEGARHAVTGGNLTGTGAYTMSVTNNAGGVIQGNNGSGLNIDGINANEVVTITNRATITGNGAMLVGANTAQDGDGVDVDGLVNLTNSGTIRSLNAIGDTSEGVTVGGGTITNQAGGLIEGDVAAGNTSGATGKGITILGVDTANPVVGMYANTVITNSGTIRGQTNSAITIGVGAAGPSGFTSTISNQAGGLIEGGGATAAAIQTGADDDTVNNSGTIRATASNLAMDLGAGNNTLNILGGAAAIVGNVSGGVGGTNALVITPGSGNRFAYAGAFSNFASVQINAGTVTLSGDSTYTGPTTVASGGTLVAANAAAGGGSATGTGAVAVQGGGALAGTGRITGAVTLAAGALLSPSNRGTLAPGQLTLGGDLNVTGGSRFSFALGSTTAGSDLVTLGGALEFSGGSGQLVFDVLDRGLTAGRYDLVDFTSVTGGLTLSNLAFGDVPAGFQGTFELDGAHVGLSVTTVPEPAATTVALLVGSLALGGGALRAWRRR